MGPLPKALVGSITYIQGGCPAVDLYGDKIINSFVELLEFIIIVYMNI